MTTILSSVLGLRFLFYSVLGIIPVSTEAPRTFVMLAHHGEEEGGYLDLQLNGTFEGSLDGQTIYYGNWNLGANEKAMTLTHDPMDEEEFEWHFQVTHVSFDALHLRLNTNRTWTLRLAD